MAWSQNIQSFNQIYLLHTNAVRQYLLLLLLLKSTNRMFLLNHEAFNLWFIIIYNILVILKRNSKPAKRQTNVLLFLPINCKKILHNLLLWVFWGIFICDVGYMQAIIDQFFNLPFSLKSFLVFLCANSLLESKNFVPVYSAICI